MLALWLAVSLSAACSTASPGETAPVQNEQQVMREITDLVRRTTRAYRQKDLETLREAYAEEFRFRLPNGEVLDRDQIFASVENGTVQINDVRMLNIDLRSVGDTAVVSATVEVDAVLHGEAIKGRFAGGGTFIRKTGKWYVIDEYFGIPIEDEKKGGGRSR